MPAHSENGEKCDGRKICASVQTMQEQCENDKKFDRKNSLQEFDAKEMILYPRINQPRSKSVERCSVCIIFECFHGAVSKNVSVRVPFSKLTDFEICRQKMCRFRVNGRPIRHFFHRFEDVPESCEHGLSLL